MRKLSATFLIVLVLAVISAASLVLGASSAGAAPTVHTLTGTPVAAPAGYIAGVDAGSEASYGEPISTVANPSATVWTAEDPDVVLTGGEILRYRLAAYNFIFAADACATFELDIDMDVTVNGPDVHTRSDYTWGIFATDLSASLAGGGLFGPTGIGQTVTLEMSATPTAAQLTAGLTLGYGTDTAIDDGAIKGSYGATYGVPVIELTEDRSACPPPTTTTTAAPAITTTTKAATPTTTAAPAKPETKTLTVNNPTPPAGGTVTVEGSGYKPATPIEVRLNTNGPLLTTTTSDDDGTFSVTVTIPPDVEGEQELVATGKGPDGEVVTSVLGINVTAATAIPSQLAATGPTNTLMLFVGLASLAAGAALLRGRRAMSE